MHKDTFRVSKMDCPSEEQLVRMKLEVLTPVKKLQFDLPNRTLVVYHTGDTALIERELMQLNLGAALEDAAVDAADPSLDEAGDRRLLWILLAINAAFFIIELSAGVVAGSMGLVADGLDMMADAVVYGISLMAVGAHLAHKKRVARISGYLQLLLALAGVAEVIRRFLGLETAPDFRPMMLVAAAALAANAVCLYLLQKKKDGGAHMQASYIFTSNDVVVNLGVILAGAAVYLLDSVVPDLIIGTIVFAFVARGALRILALSR